MTDDKEKSIESRIVLESTHTHSDNKPECGEGHGTELLSKRREEIKRENKIRA